MRYATVFFWTLTYYPPVVVLAVRFRSFFALYSQVAYGGVRDVFSVLLLLCMCTLRRSTPSARSSGQHVSDF
ncbi:hypothetical protein C8Q74DRAFT_387581 [Fomes fomentarius]|nr:hypothetical protein C8Q74DRAFT_387581 [Fomes fomentarius]